MTPSLQYRTRKACAKVKRQCIFIYIFLFFVHHSHRCSSPLAMASSNSLLSEEQLQCSICLEIFTKPVSTPCGHNYCMACLNKCWDNNQQYRCPFCKKQFSKRPELCVNTFISNLVAQFKESVKVQSSTRIKKPHAAQGNVPCDVCTDPAQKSCLDCGMSLCAKHLEPHKTAAKLKPHRIIDAVKNLEDFICQKHQKPLELFCRNDQTCVCLFCTEGEHKSHKTVRLEEECTERKVRNPSNLLST